MFRTLDTHDTTFPADSIEWCTAEDFEDIFVCGTYQLTANDGEGPISSNASVKSKRVGRIYLYQVISDKKLMLKLLQRVDTAAILDMKWAHVKSFDNKILLGVVNSIGFLQIYELIKAEENVVFLKFLTEILVNDRESQTLALSLDWSTGKRNSSDNREVQITVSDSAGSISLFRICENGIEKVFFWHAHEYEAWTAAFDYWNTNIIYTGGDDCKCLRYDTRIDLGFPTNTNRSHNAGVTSLHCSWKKEFYFVSGSYDESLRTWDLRSFRRPVSEISLHGGIWRLKWDPFDSKYLLAACMYNGFCLVDCDHLDDPKIVSEYKEHESIAYGCDWSYLNRQCHSRKKLLNEENETLIGTCSFYDHILKLSSVTFYD